MLTTALGLALLTLQACSSPQDRAYGAATRAQQLYDAGDYQSAKVEISKAITLRDDIVQLWLLRGRIELALSNLNGAYFAFSSALDLDAANVEASQLVTQLAFQTGRFKEANKLADKSLIINPNDVTAIIIKGLVAMNQKRLPDAMAYAETALTKAPGNEGAVVLKARVLTQQGKPAEAVALIQENAASLDKSQAAVSTLIEIHRRQGDFQNISVAFERLIAMSPNNLNLKFDYARVLYKGGNPLLANKILLEMIRAQPSNRVLLQQITDLWLDAAVAPLDASTLARLSRDGSPETRFAMARFLLATGKAGNVGSLVQPLVAAGLSTSDGIEAQGILSLAQYALGQFDRSAQLADGVLAEDANNTDALLVRTRVRLKRNDLKGALTDVQLAVRDSPKSADARIAQADVFETRREQLRARKTYEDAINDLPQSALLIEKYAEFLYRAGDRGRLVTVTQDFTRRNKASERGWKAFALACRQVASPCIQQATVGLAQVDRNFEVDVRPGAPTYSGLYGKI